MRGSSGWWLFVGVLLGACSSAAPPPSAPLPSWQALAQGTDRLPLDPSVDALVLRNGVTYLGRPSAKKDGVVRMSLVVRAGRLMEGADERGLAHFVEHVAFEGTTRFPQAALAEQLGGEATWLTADTNAFTGPDVTRYDLTTSSRDPEAIARTLRLLADWATAISFEPGAVDKQREIVLAERRQSTSAERRFAERREELLLLPEVASARSAVASATPDALRSFHKRWYQPQNLALIVTGDFDPPTLRRGMIEHFGAIPTAPNGTAAASAVPRAEAPRSTIVSDAEAFTDLLSVAWSRPPRRWTTRAEYGAYVLDQVLVTLIQRRLELASYDPTSSLLVVRVDTQREVTRDQLRVFAVGTPGSLLSATHEVTREIARLVARPFEPDELAAARARVEHQLEEGRTLGWGPDARTSSLLDHFTYGDSVVDNREFPALDGKALAACTLEAVNERARWWLQDEQPQLLALTNPRHGLVDSASFTSAASAGRAAAREPYAPAPVPELFIRFPPLAVKPRLEETPPGTDLKVWSFDNGLRVVFKPNKYEAGRVRLAAFGPQGTALGPADRAAQAQVALALGEFLGVGEHSHRTVQTILSRQDVTLKRWLTSDEAGFGGEASITGLRTMLQLINQRFTSPRRDVSELAAFRSLMRAIYSAGSPDLLGDAIERELWRGHPGHVTPSEADVERLELDEAVALQHEHFSAPGDFTWVMVGDAMTPHQQSQIVYLLGQYLGTLPASKARRPLAPDTQPREGITRVRVRQGTTERAKVMLVFHGQGPIPEAAEQELEALQYYAQMRLVNELRERLRAVYGVRASFSRDVPPRKGYRISFWFTCAPERAEELSRAALDVLERLKVEDPPAPLLQAMKQQREKHAEVGLYSNEAWLNALLDTYRRGLDPSKITSTWQTQAGIGVDELKESAARYLRADQYVEGILLPEEATAEQR